MPLKQKHKERVMGFGISCVAIILCLVIAELALGFILPDWGTFRYQPDDDIGYRLEPNEKSMVNEAGFRDYLYSEKKPSGVFRIVGIGDSQTASCGFTPIANAYLKVLEATLNAEAQEGVQYQVLNMGVPNYTPHEYLGMVKKYGLAYRPDLVLVALYVGNDIQVLPENKDYVVFDGKLISRRALNLADRSEFEVRVWKWFHERKLYRVLQRANYASIWSAHDPSTGGGFNRLSVFVNEQSRSSAERETMKQAWQDVVESLHLIHETVKEQDAGLVLILIPEEHQINKSLRTKSLQELRRHEKDYDFMQWNRKLASFCQENNILFLDLSHGLVKVIEQERLYFKNDIHLNERGHQLMGELIKDFLHEHQLLPSVQPSV